MGYRDNASESEASHSVRTETEEIGMGAQAQHTNDHMEKYFGVFYSNITTWGPQAQSFLFSQNANEDIHMHVENHAPEDQISTFKNM